MKNLRRALTGIAALVLAGGLANAATLNESFTSLGTAQTDFTGTMNVAQFDPSLGTLQSIAFSFGANASTTLSIVNSALASSDAIGNARVEVDATIDDGGLNFGANGNTPEITLIWPAGIVNPPCPAGTISGYCYDLAPGTSTSSGLLAKNGSDSFTIDVNSINYAAIIAEFTGKGNASLNGHTFTQTLLANNGGNATEGQTTNALLTGSLVYTYVPTGAAPEPTTLFLMGSALVGIGLIRKKIVSK